jgi:hypothetical protein
LIAVSSIVLIIVFGHFSISLLLTGLGTAAVVYSLTKSPMISTIAGVIGLFGAAALTRYMGNNEGFNVFTTPTEISNTLRSLKSNKAYNIPGFEASGHVIEGFEDEGKSKKESKPAPAEKKEELPMPFKLGEIPSQVKNGPHIDAGSTLMKAIQSLNPEQINAMTKDTKQLIDTQKSLMGMLGTMKPMMNDGKELMETFQQMFGQ